MNRIDLKFKELRDKKKKAFIAFITAGDPHLRATEEMVLAFEENGVDIMELGVPFSDPMADGPTIQASSQRALKSNTTLEKILKTVQSIRKKSEIPIALMTYYNPVFVYGEEKFVKDAKAAGVDGVIIPDLPPEEAGNLVAAARTNDFSTIFFVSPTTTERRMKKITDISTGFIYYVSLTGVTGARQDLAQYFLNNIVTAKRFTEVPVCVGFGISTPAQVKNIANISDGVVVGSAIIKEVEKHSNDKDIAGPVSAFVKTLTNALIPE